MKDYKEVDERFDKIFNIDVFCSSQANLLWDKFKAHLHTELARERIEGAREVVERANKIINANMSSSLTNVWSDVEQALAEMEKSKSVIK